MAQHQHQLLLVGLGLHPRGRIRPAVEAEVDVAVDQPGQDRRPRVIRPRQPGILLRQRLRAARPRHQAVAKHHRPVRDGLRTGDDPRRGEDLLRHHLSLPQRARPHQMGG